MHSKRAAFAARYPVHVTLRLRKGLSSLRTIPIEVALREIFCVLKAREGFKLCHYSIQSNHLHLIVEADDRASLSRGMQSLCVRVAKRLNRIWNRRGRVFAGRYHDEILRSPRQVRNAIIYVLTNAWKHGARLRAALDRFASGWCFDGFKQNVIVHGTKDIETPVQAAKTWLLATGWKRHGFICIDERASATPS